MSISTTPRRRWRVAAVGLALAVTPVTVACGSDTAGGGQQVEDGEQMEDGEEMEEDEETDD